MTKKSLHSEKQYFWSACWEYEYTQCHNYRVPECCCDQRENAAFDAQAWSCQASALAGNPVCVCERYWPDPQLLGNVGSWKAGNFSARAALQKKTSLFQDVPKANLKKAALFKNCMTWPSGRSSLCPRKDRGTVTHWDFGSLLWSKALAAHINVKSLYWLEISLCTSTSGNSQNLGVTSSFHIKTSSGFRDWLFLKTLGSLCPSTGLFSSPSHLSHKYLTLHVHSQTETPGPGPAG